MKLTERKKVSGLTLTDLIHVVITGDTSQDPQGSSYSADMSQIIGLFPTPAITIVNSNNLFSTGLPGSGNFASGVTYSNFFGVNAGSGATNADNSNFIGNNAGYNGVNAVESNFFGASAGYNAANASNSNFFGTDAGNGATYAAQTNFLGSGAGLGAINSTFSNYLGYEAGANAINANNSNFFGNSAGGFATNAHSSNFFGSNAGYFAIDASHSNLFGYNVGNADILGSIGTNNIIIGTNISLAAGTTNGINLGGVLFGTNTYGITSGNPSISAQPTGMIGINVVNPIAALHVSGNTLIKGNFTASTVSATTYYNLPLSATTDTFVTANTLNPSTYDLTLTRNDGISLTANLGQLANDVKVTGGTYDKNTGIIVFTNNSGGTFSVSGFTTGLTETYSNSSGTTSTIGGISAGSTFSNQTMTQMWDALLYPYQTPAFSSFARGNLSTDYDLGRPVLNGSQTFTWGTSNSGNVQANTIKIDQLFPSTVNLLTGSANDGTETINLTGAIISAASPTTISMYRITATNSKSIDFTTTISRTWKHRWYYGKNINASLTNAQITGLTTTELITAAKNTAISFTSSASPEYLYLVVPQNLTPATDWRNSTTGCFGNNIPYSNIGSTSITNVYGISTTYNVYRSVNQITGGQDVWLCA